MITVQSSETSLRSCTK